MKKRPSALPATVSSCLKRVSSFDEADNSTGGTAETARDLAYRLYTMCERKKWAQEAPAYNGLVIAWPELTKLAAQPAAGRQQGALELGG